MREKIWGIVSGCFLFLLMVSCEMQPEKNTAAQLSLGLWRGTLAIQGQQLPFHLDLTKDSSGGFDAYLINGEERLLLDEVFIQNDSINIPLHVFDANLKGIISGDTIRGNMIRNYLKDGDIPLLLVHGQSFRFPNVQQKNSSDFSGKYRVQFRSELDTTEAVGIFKQQGDRVTGTFLTPTGDYRFLEGSASGDSLWLSTFDGNHAYLFKAAKREDGILNGIFLAGLSGRESWTAIPDEDAALPESTTGLRPGFEKIAFTFPDTNNKLISLSDEAFKGKVVVVQILGSWCPNCMDETKFLAPWYEQNKQRGVEIIGLAYERKADYQYARDRVARMMEKFDVGYPVLIAGTNDKEEASKTLPMLTEIASFPTTIFIGKDGKVRKIHSGFTGPGTGNYYDGFIEQFNATINELLNENMTSLKY